jgi:hypothetical protein
MASSAGGACCVPYFTWGMGDLSYNYWSSPYIYIYNNNSMDVHGKGIVTGNAPVRTYSEKKISIWEA